VPRHVSIAGLSKTAECYSFFDSPAFKTAHRHSRLDSSAIETCLLEALSDSWSFKTALGRQFGTPTLILVSLCGIRGESGCLSAGRSGPR
jgi:hypothetical protein